MKETDSGVDTVSAAAVTGIHVTPTHNFFSIAKSNNLKAASEGATGACVFSTDTSIPRGLVYFYAH